MAHPPFCIPDLLELPVPITIVRIFGTIPFPITGILAPPILLGLLLVLAVIRIGFHFLALPLGPSGILAGLFPAIPLIFNTRIGREESFAMAAADVNSHGSPPGEPYADKKIEK